MTTVRAIRVKRIERRVRDCDIGRLAIRGSDWVEVNRPIYAIPLRLCNVIRKDKCSIYMALIAAERCGGEVDAVNAGKLLQQRIPAGCRLVVSLVNDDKVE